MRRPAERGNRGGFTLVEIMIVIMVISILIAIAVPNFINARANGRLKSCISNLREVESAKEQFALETQASNGDPVGWGNIVPDYVKKQPACPAGGDYALLTIGDTTTCTIADHVF